MKKLFATVTYSFNNFYNNLNVRGQMIFSIIVFLIILLCLILLITYIFQGIQNKARISKIKTRAANFLKNNQNKDTIKDEKSSSIEEDNNISYEGEKTEIEDIASKIGDALKEEPISLTNFEEDQERTAIISIDELMKRAKELELIDDEEDTGVNYLEKYNLEPSEETTNIAEDSNEVKAFKVSQVISPIYGVKKEVLNGDEEA